MKKLYIVIFTLFSISVFAGNVDQKTARNVATNFLIKNTSIIDSNARATSQIILNLVYPEQTTSTLTRSTSFINTPFYIYNFDNGYIIVSNEDAVYPILGYSIEGTYIDSLVSPQLQYLLESYKDQIRFVRSNSIDATDDIKSTWINLNSEFNKNNNSVATSTYIEPLIKTMWDQSPYVNALCPYDQEKEKYTLTGCVATAMAQIMKYWEYPSSGVGFHSYNHEKYGTLSANFASSHYDWEAMPEIISSDNWNVANLMYHCGVSVEMEYNVEGSSSYVIMQPDEYPNNRTAQNALVQYFGYDNSRIKGLIRKDYSEKEWKELLITELNEGRPIQYAGFTNGESTGHTWIVDGYENDLFHMNWGWGEQSDYLRLESLNPYGIRYNDNHQAIIGITPPPSALKYELDLYADVEINKSIISYGEEFEISTNILNVGDYVFNGDFCAAVFDENNAFIDYVEIKSELSLPPNHIYENYITFTTDGLLSLLPGDYKIYIYYRSTNGNWVAVKGDTNDLLINDYAEITIQNNNDIRLFSDIEILTEDIYKNLPFSVSLDVANYSATQFQGSFFLSLYSFNGDFVYSIEEKKQILLNSNFSLGLDFSTTSLDVEPGTYLLALTHQQNGSSSQQLSGSTLSYTNPIKIQLNN